MNEQSDPIEPNEYILRRILNHKNFYNPSLPIPITRAALSPTENDIDGISVYRENFVSAKQISEAGTNINGYYVAKFKAEDALKIGLTIKPAPIIDELPGHSLIPELGLNSKITDIKLYKKNALKLIKLLSVVYIPNKNGDL